MLLTAIAVAASTAHLLHAEQRITALIAADEHDTAILDAADTAISADDWTGQ